MRFKLAVLIFVCSLFLLHPHMSQAQATTSLGGHVVDAGGASVAGADVTLTLTTTGTVRTGKTNQSGEYQFSQLLPGKYDIEVASPGLRRRKRPASSFWSVNRLLSISR